MRRSPAPGDRRSARRRHGGRPAELVPDRGDLSAPGAREGFLRIVSVLREEAGLSVERATTFLAHGMLVSTVLGLQLPGEDDDPAVAELLEATFRENTPLVRELFGDRDIES